MSIESIVILAIIVILSVIAVKTSDEPLDELFHVNAAINGFTLPPLATKVTSEPQGTHTTQVPSRTESVKDTLADSGAERKMNHLAPQSTTTF